jgi:membrane-bound lytic murein transglycosylase A
MRIFIIFLMMFVVSCEEAQEPAPPPKEEIVEEVVEEKPPELVLQPASFADLPDWGADDFESFVPAFTRTCDRVQKKSPKDPFGPLEAAGTYGDWQVLCRDFLSLEDKSGDVLQAFFEARFAPHIVRADERSQGLFTGYYEASLNGAREESARYRYPLHKRPDDLVMVQLGQFRESLKGQRIAGRVVAGNLRPYESRADIVNGDWPHAGEVLVWVDDAVDAFFVQIQGSGVVQMEDGSKMRIGYAGQNGHPYYAIGRELIARGELSKENVSMQSIRAWLAANPALADEIMNTNASYVFFREIKGDGPIGGEGVALTPGRSLAVDRSLMSYGVPLWVDIKAPEGADKDIRRLMIAQDTGGAIRGPVRGDVFWGYGDVAESFAGKMKSQGRYWVLLPK